MPTKTIHPPLHPSLTHQLRKQQRKNKFNATSKQVGPYKCDSTLEAAYIAYLVDEREREEGPVVNFLFHPKFHFKSGMTWEADALVFYEVGDALVIDVKSKATETRSFKDKLKLMADEYPEFPIKIVRRIPSGLWIIDDPS